VVAPGPSAGGAARAGFGAAGITVGREGIVVGGVPVAAPLVDVGTDVKQAVGGGLGLADGFGAGLPASRVVGERFGRRVSPGKTSAFTSAAGGAFPFGFSGEAAGAARGRGEPVAVSNGFVPGDADDGLMRVREVCVAPERGWKFAGGAEEASVVFVGDLVDGEQKRVDGDAVNGAFVVLTFVGPHEEGTGEDGDELRFAENEIWLGSHGGNQSG